MNLPIDAELVHRLIAAQFPQWEDLSIWPVTPGGWDNRTFHLGEKMLVRMPSSTEYALQVEKEQKWLPKLAHFLPLSIPSPLAIGEPTDEYPMKWSIYQWLEGDAATSAPIADLCDFATSLAQFLNALHHIDSKEGPVPGLHSFYRGGSLTTYDIEIRQAIENLKGKIDTSAATEIWEVALATTWHGLPVWVHGDISAGNLLVHRGRLSAVIDFGQLSVGDPACDLAIAWTMFKSESRKVFRNRIWLSSLLWKSTR